MTAIAFDESKHARTRNGRFTDKVYSEPSTSLALAHHAYRGPDEMLPATDAEHYLNTNELYVAARNALHHAEGMRTAAALQALPTAVRYYYPNAIGVVMDKDSREITAVHNLDGTVVDNDPAAAFNEHDPTHPDRVCQDIDWARALSSGAAGITEDGDTLQVHLEASANDGVQLSHALADTPPTVLLDATDIAEMVELAEEGIGSRQENLRYDGESYEPEEITAIERGFETVRKLARRVRFQKSAGIYRLGHGEN